MSLLVALQILLSFELFQVLTGKISKIIVAAIGLLLLTVAINLGLKFLMENEDDGHILEFLFDKFGIQVSSFKLFLYV